MYQQARKDNRDPNEFLSEVVNQFTPQRKQQWNNMMGQIQGVKTK